MAKKYVIRTRSKVRRPIGLPPWRKSDSSLSIWNVSPAATRTFKGYVSSYGLMPVIGSIDLKPIRSKDLRSLPYSLICQLTMTFRNGVKKGGSGFLIGHGKLIATAAHNLLDPNPRLGQPKRVAVKVGGKLLSRSLGGDSLKPSRQWLDKPIEGAPYDFGFIIPPSRIDVTFTLEPSIDRIKQIKSAKVLGYPIKDRRVKFQVRRGTLCEADGAILGVDNRGRIMYDADTIIGMSGGPICCKLDGIHKALGIHIGGTKTHNKAVSFSKEFLKDAVEFDK